MEPESPEAIQQEEIYALRNIFDEDYIECPPPKAWKGAPRLPEFIIRVKHRDPEYSDKIYFNLHTKFPKTYPTLATATFTIKQPIVGLKPHEVTKLSNAIHAEAQRIKGREAVFEIVTFAQEWIATNVEPPVEVSGSLATQMIQRAIAEEQAKKQREEAEAEEELERENQRALEMQEQIRADAERQQIEKEEFHKARKRAMSDATEIAPLEDFNDPTPIETFNEVIQWQGVSFTTVRLFHPRKESLGTVWHAEPIADDAQISVQLEVRSITFESRYYSTSQGRKKLRQVESEIKRLISIRHSHLLTVLSVKLAIPHSSGSPKLVILCEGRPSVTLDDVLQDCDSLREERASDYLGQLLSALNAIHTADLVHRGITPKCIGLVSGTRPGESKQVKLFNVAYHVRLLDMHRSDPIGPDIGRCDDEPPLPEEWMPKDALESSLVYTKSRDIHAAGIVLLKMLLGRDVVAIYPDVHAALRNATITPRMQGIVLNMLAPTNKKGVTCFSLMTELAGVVFSHAQKSPTIPISIGPKTPMPHQYQFNGSPESDYFKPPPPKVRQSSRWKDDWEELELLGRGGFGSVVKARNKMDNQIYAVKKIRLRATPSANEDQRIFREVNVLSRVNHRNIVRYYTAWVEVSESASTVASSMDSESGTSVPDSRTHSHNGDDESNPFVFDMDDLGSVSRNSFPSIRFTRSGTPSSGSEGTGDGSDEDEDGASVELLNGDLFSTDLKGKVAGRRNTLQQQHPSRPAVSRTLYIQMEYVERQTLQERIAEGLSEAEAWRLFQQIIDALVHLSSNGILHRDIKLTNIFIDGNGDCKVGDFGLATTSLAVERSDAQPGATADSDMTLDVGTKLYIAPEVEFHRGGPRNFGKADMYSLGIVFFEMNYPFKTGAERIAVLDALRRPDIQFPPSWDPRRTRQRQIITWLLQRNPDDRPTALELSQSSLLPPRMEDEYFKNTLKMMVKADTPHYQAVLSTLFGQTVKPSRAYLYDAEVDMSENATLNPMVHDRLVQIFRLHGAIEMEPSLLLPVMNPEDDQSRAMFLDRHGEVVALPNNALTPFARLAARANIRRIKRYHIGDIYRPIVTPGHPKTMKAAVFDIITPDVVNGSAAAAAEAISIVNTCIESFANLGSYEIHISHTKIYDTALSRISAELRSEVIKVLDQSKSSQSQKRSNLLRKGVPRNVVDELEVLMEIEEDMDVIISKLERVSPQLLALLLGPFEEIKNAVNFAIGTGVNRPLYFHPLFMLSNPNTHFKDGVCFVALRRHKRSDVLALGGRYDHLISRFSPPKPKSEPTCAIAVQIFIDKITLALASFQSASQKMLLKERRSFGYWSPRRCDVYVVSHQEGHLADRLEVTSWLWQNGISADLMYEFGLRDTEHENVIDQCAREGILFVVYPRPRTARRDQAAFKVKSVLRGTEYEASRQELVPFLLQQIAEQKRIDAGLSGVSTIPENPQSAAPPKEPMSSVDAQVVLPGDAKKQRKTKQMFLDRAFEYGIELKNSLLQSGMPILGVDVPITVFEEMSKNTSWITDEDAWKTLVSGFPPQHTPYAHQVRDSVFRRKADGCKFLILFAVREERAALLTLSG
ncbi:Serine/threonine-protein kinase [Panus rudis PR-1116 ss-1]|nr:Serine/threonine-protein kinase [Panus rudis PR-1116 ss-1]